jgi:hypothetical protein
MTTRRRNAPTPADAENLPAVRLAAPASALSELGLDVGSWKVLTESIFPSAKTPEGVLLAVRYCQARKLDIMRRPVHVVPMWSTAVGREVETVWPGIAEVQTTAARTGQWAGMDAPRFGPDKTRTFRGRVRGEEGWQDIEVMVTFPAWCEVTVYRVVQGTRCPFTETVWWEETYSRAGGARSEVPTDMWVKRPHGQLLKTFLSGEPLVSLSAQDATGSRMSSEAPSTLLEAGVEARIAASGRAVTDLNPLVTATPASYGPHAGSAQQAGHEEDT